MTEPPTVQPMDESQGRASPFDDMAIDYDQAFTHSLIGAAMRRAVWDRLDVHFDASMRVIELGCGTGEDALYLARRGVSVLATDPSRAMLEVAEKKLAAAGYAQRVRLQQLKMEYLESLPVRVASAGKAGAGHRFDGAFSNFGALNCASDLDRVRAGLTHVLRPGASVLLCIMGPLVPWEWLWFMAHRQPKKALRRLIPGGSEWRGLRIRYPSIGRVRQVFSDGFQFQRVGALGALVPPPYAESRLGRYPGLLASLNRWERWLESVRPLPWLADHYLIEFTRR